MKKGQLLLETIIGVGVVGILLSAIIPLFLVGIKGGSEAWKSDIGRMLAQEELEAAKALKEENWNNIYRPLAGNNKGAANPYHVVSSGNVWTLVAGAESVSFNNVAFERKIVIDNVSRTGINGAGEIEALYTPTRDDPSTQKLTVTISWPGSPGIEKIDYFSRWQNSLWQQTDWSAGQGQANWQDPPGNRYFSGTQIDATTVAGTLRLAKIPGGGTSNYGNQFIMNSLTTIYRLNNPNYRLSMRFTAQKSGNVGQLRIYLAAFKNSGGINYRYGIQADKGGFPSGTFLSSATANFNSTGWQIVNLPSPAVLTAGNVYHLVVQYDSGNIPNTNRYIDIRSTNPLNGLIPQTMLADTSANTLRFNGTAWALLDQQPLYVLGFDDGTFEGNPFDNRGNRSIYGKYVEGEKFTLTQVKDITGVGLYLAKNSLDLPADNLYVTVKDLTTNTTLVNETFITPDAVETVFAWKAHSFASTINLPAGHQFSLTFSSPGSNSARCYLISNLSNPDTPEFNGLNWDGINSLVTRSTNSGTTFTDYAFIDLSYYLIVSASEVYAPWGELISSTLDTGNPQGGGFNRISWATVGGLPSHTTIKMQLAANNDNSTWQWTGPGGLGTWYTLSTGENIWTGLYSATASQPARYLRYKIRLDTTDPTATPVVDWTRVNWSK